MKYIFVFCFMNIIIQGFGQKLALLDKTLKQPILIAETVSEEQIQKGLIPVEIKDLDTFYANLNFIETILAKPETNKLSSFELRAGPSVFLVTKMLTPGDDRYNISLRSRIDDLNCRYILANGTKTNKELRYEIKDLKNYLLSIKSLFRADYEIYPKMYNAIAIPQ